MPEPRVNAFPRNRILHPLDLTGPTHRSPLHANLSYRTRGRPDKWWRSTTGGSSPLIFTQIGMTALPALGPVTVQLFQTRSGVLGGFVMSMKQMTPSGLGITRRLPLLAHIQARMVHAAHRYRGPPLEEVDVSKTDMMAFARVHRTHVRR